MADEYGPTFITVTDEDGREIVLEFVDALEYKASSTRLSSLRRQKERMRIRTMDW